MNEGYVKVSWENNAKTGAAENVLIDTEASATEEATVACLMVRHACETIAQYSSELNKMRQRENMYYGSHEILGAKKNATTGRIIRRFYL